MAQMNVNLPVCQPHWAKVVHGTSQIGALKARRVNHNQKQIKLKRTIERYMVTWADKDTSLWYAAKLKLSLLQFNTSAHSAPTKLPSKRAMKRIIKRIRVKLNLQIMAVLYSDHRL